MEDVKQNKINFLGITIAKEEENISFSIHRKPKTTDTIIPNYSCLPQERKLASIRYLTDRMETYNLNVNNKEKSQHNKTNVIQQ
jgi:hypothetical protein